MAAVLEDPQTLEQACQQMERAGQLYEIVYGEIREKIVGTKQNLLAGRIVSIVYNHDPRGRLGQIVPENLFILDQLDNLRCRLRLARTLARATARHKQLERHSRLGDRSRQPQQLVGTRNGQNRRIFRSRRAAGLDDFP